MQEETRQVDSEDNWSQVLNRGTSGRGDNQNHYKVTHLVPVTRGRTPNGNGRLPATNTNRMELGSNAHYRQLMFEETAERSQT